MRLPPSQCLAPWSVIGLVVRRLSEGSSILTCDLPQYTRAVRTAVDEAGKLHTPMHTKFNNIGRPHPYPQMQVTSPMRIHLCKSGFISVCKLLLLGLSTSTPYSLSALTVRTIDHRCCTGGVASFLGENGQGCRLFLYI